MKCDEIKKIIVEYIENDHQDIENKEVKDHLRVCASCREYSESLQKTWDFLINAEEIAPQPGYISRFWTELSLRTPWYKKILNSLDNLLKVRKLAPVYVTLLIALIVGAFSVRNYFQLQKTPAYLTNLTESEIEMVENIELAENLDIIDDLDFLQDLEVIENLDLVASQQT